MSITRNQIFLMSYSKFFSSKSSLWSYCRWVPRRFLKISIIYNQNFHFNLVFLGVFQKLKHAYIEHTRKRFYRMLSIRGTDFIVHWAYEEWISAHAQPAVKCEQCYMYNPCWAYAERILSHTEHTRNEFHAEHTRKCCKVKYVGQIKYDLQKYLVTCPWDHMVSVSEKKVKKNISCLCTFKRKADL